MLHFITDNHEMNYEFLNPIYFDEYCVVAPAAKSIPLFVATSSCFTPTVWFFILTIPWTSTFVLKNLRKLSPLYEEGLRVTHFLRMVGLFYCVLISISYNVKTKSTIERWILSGCMGFSIIFVTIYNANLTSHITSDTKYKDLVSLKDLAQSNFKILINSPFMMNIVFYDDNDPVMEKLHSKLKLGNDSIYKTVARKDCVLRLKMDFDIINVSTLFKDRKI